MIARDSRLWHPAACIAQKGSSVRIGAGRWIILIVGELPKRKTMMTAKNYLNQLKLMDIKIKQLMQERDKLITAAMCNSSPELKPDKVQTSIGGDPMGDKIAECADLCKDIDKRLKRLQKRRAKVIREIHSLDKPKHIELLYLHYVEYRTLENCADIMRKSNGYPYSYDHIRDMHRKALAEFSRKVLKSHSNPTIK